VESALTNNLGAVSAGDVDACLITPGCVARATSARTPSAATDTAATPSFTVRAKARPPAIREDGSARCGSELVTMTLP
jgi:hypothetical protein